VISFLFSQTAANGVHSQVLRVEFDLVQLDLGVLGRRCLFVEHVCVLAVLLVAVIFHYNFGALGPFRLVSNRNGAEPYFFDFSASFEHSLQLLGTGIDGYVSHEHSPQLPFFEHESTEFSLLDERLLRLRLHWFHSRFDFLWLLLSHFLDGRGSGSFFDSRLDCIHLLSHFSTI